VLRCRGERQGQYLSSAQVDRSVGVFFWISVHVAIVRTKCRSMSAGIVPANFKDIQATLRPKICVFGALRSLGEFGCHWRLTWYKLLGIPSCCFWCCAVASMHWFRYCARCMIVVRPIREIIIVC